MPRRPLARARYYGNVLPGSLFRHLRSTFDRLAAMAYEGQYESIAHLGRGLWFPLDRPVRSVMEQVILALRPLAAPGRKCRGAEWWIRIGGADEAKQWHFDLDERLATESGKASHPVWASVFYLGGVGGATLVTDQVAANERIDQGLSPQQARSAAAVAPRPNRFFVFPGALYHCVLAGPSNPAERRMTLLINWWDREPGAYREPVESVPELPLLAPVRTPRPSAAKALELRMLQGAELEHLMETAGPG